MIHIPNNFQTLEIKEKARSDKNEPKIVVAREYCLNLVQFRGSTPRNIWSIEGIR